MTGAPSVDDAPGRGIKCAWMFEILMLRRVAAECSGDICQIRGQTVRVITSTRPIGRSLIEVKAEFEAILLTPSRTYDFPA